MKKPKNHISSRKKIGGKIIAVIFIIAVAVNFIIFISDIINRYEGDYRESSTLIGSLLLAAGFYFIMFFRGRALPNFAFALCCFLLAVGSRRFISSLLPSNISPDAAFRVELVIIIAAAVCVCSAFALILKTGGAAGRFAAAGTAVLLISRFFGVSFQNVLPDFVINEIELFTVFVFIVCEMIALGLENSELERLNNMKTEFLQNMSHELKTPLAIVSADILNAADQLDYEMDADDMRGSLKNAQREIMRMSRMVDRAVKISHKRGPEKEPMELLDTAAVLRGGAEACRAMIERGGNSLTVDVPESLPAVYGSADMLRGVISNLLSNAGRHTRGGEIRVNAKKENGSVITAVIDNGEGIARKIYPCLFKRGASAAGTGYGLSICKDAVEAHNGEISIKSEPGKGAAVVFTLPAFDLHKKGGQNE